MKAKQRHRILVIDDQAAIHEDYRKILGRQDSSTALALGQAAAELFGDDPKTIVEWEGFELDSAFQGKEGLELVRRALDERRPYAVAFVDVRMPPGWDGIETVRHIWEADPEILIVICSAYSDYSWHDMVRELGRNDRYLILKKPFDNIEVRQCAMALSERWSVSRTDVLTGLLNRRAFRSYLELEWERSTRHNLPLAYAMIDLDGFKHVNDSLGHQTGDAVLKHITGLLQSSCRASDFVCRYGGDEICVLLPHTHERDAVTWAEHTRLAIEAQPLALGRCCVQVTASFGVADRLSEGDTAECLIERADQALILAKQRGRNRVAGFSNLRHAADPANRATHRIPWEGATLAEVMSAPVISLRSDATVRDAVGLLLQFHLALVPVVDREGRLLGTLSEADLMGILSSRDSLSLPVEAMVRREAVCYGVDTPLQSVAAFLSTTAESHVFIVRDRRPVGIVHRSSLLRWYAERIGSSAQRQVPAAAVLSGGVNQQQLAEDARAVAHCAAQLSATAGNPSQDAALAALGAIADLQALIDDMLTSRQRPSPPPVLDISGTSPGSAGTPLTPSG